MQDQALSQKFMEVIPVGMQLLREELRGAAWKGVSTPQLRVLLRLHKRPQTASDLAKGIGVSLPSLSRMVDMLVRRGYVLRAPSSEDRRRITLRVSAEGARKVTALRAKAQLRISERLDCIDPAKKEKLLEGLRILEELHSGNATN